MAIGIVMLIRSLGTIEGVIEQFCPELNLFEILSNKMMERAKKSFDLEQQLISSGKEILEIGKKTAKIPVLASDLLKSAARGRMKMNMELTGYEELPIKRPIYRPNYDHEVREAFLMTDVPQDRIYA